MKILFPLAAALLLSLASRAQQSTLDIAGMHQLINESKDEYDQQVKAKNQQATATANEKANLDLFSKLKTISRTLQQRYYKLGLAVNAAQVGIYAAPEIEHIVSLQAQITSLADGRPLLVPIAIRSEIEFVEKANDLLEYVTGLTLSLGDVNGMKESDRKLLFDYVITELRHIGQLSANLLAMLRAAELSSLVRSSDPFSNYVITDKQMAEQIIANAKFLNK